MSQQTESTLAHHHLVLGGARSGKSRYAENWINLRANTQSSQKVYIATATAGDEEMQQRIALHQQQRDDQWQLIEEPVDLAGTLNKHNSADSLILIDCLTLWLSNCLHQKNWPEQRQSFIDALKNSNSNVVMVSNDVGSGIIPMGQLSRQFVDESGCLQQTLAEICVTVTYVIAGLPLDLKNGV